MKKKKKKNNTYKRCDCGSHFPLVLRPVTASMLSMGRWSASLPIFLKIGKQGLFESDSQDYNAHVQLGILAINQEVLPAHLH